MSVPVAMWNGEYPLGFSVIIFTFPVNLILDYCLPLLMFSGPTRKLHKLPTNLQDG